MTGMRLQADRSCKACPGDDALPFGFRLRHTAVDNGIAPCAGVNLDDGCAQLCRHFDLLRISRDEQRYPHAGLAQAGNERRQRVVLPDRVQTALGRQFLAPFIARLGEAGVRVSLFIAADPRQIEMAAKLGAPVIEIHTGAWCDAVVDGHAGKAESEWQRIAEGARLARSIGLEVHAGHGLDYGTAEKIASLSEIVELNIGYFMIGEALFTGLADTVRAMRAAMDRGRKSAGSGPADKTQAGRA